MPLIYIIAGSNGAGKTTAANTLLPKFLNIKEFVNADSIAAGLSPFQPETVAFQAGRIMLTRIKQLIIEKADFAFETTLTTKSYLSILGEAKRMNYEIILFYFWVNSVELALERIAERVEMGGHDVPDEVVRRRYSRSLNNLINLFIPIANYWFVVNNSQNKPELLVEGKFRNIGKIYNKDLWRKINEFSEKK
jgi:predicted ABC-type ATPase